MASPRFWQTLSCKVFTYQKYFTDQQSSYWDINVQSCQVQLLIKGANKKS